jgi:hypothetical protein
MYVYGTEGGGAANQPSVGLNRFGGHGFIKHADSVRQGTPICRCCSASASGSSLLARIYLRIFAYPYAIVERRESDVCGRAVSLGGLMLQISYNGFVNFSITYFCPINIWNIHTVD